MIHDNYYMILPNEVLISQIGSMSDDVRSILSVSELWKGEFPDKGVLTQIDAEILIKGLFLLGMHEIPDVSSAILAISRERIVISPEFFEKYWNIIKLYEDNNIREAIKDYKNITEFREFVSRNEGGISKFVESITNENY